MLKGIVKKQLIFGTDLTQDISEKKNIQKVNTISFWICILLLSISRNNIGPIGCALFLINHLLFRIIKYIKVYTVSFSLILTLIVCYSLVSGTYQGTCFTLVGISILILINISSLKLASLLVLIIMMVEVFVCKYHSHVSWIFTYSRELETLFAGFMITQLGIYLVALYCSLKKRELIKYLRDESKSLFSVIKSIGDDINTPVRRIRRNVNKCLYGEIDFDSKEELVSSLNRLESDILGIQGIRGNQRNFLEYDNKCITNVSRLTEEICSSFKYHALIKRVEINTDIEMALFVKIDKVSYSEILNNLIENAIKSIGYNGTITVTVEAVESNVYIHVKDTGEGISDAEINRIFEVYSQIDCNNKSVSGIGLAISKTICNVWSGKIDLESEKGKGSCVRLIFPLMNESIINSKLSGAEYNREAETIMVVTDDEDIKKTFTRKLIASFNLIVVRNGHEAMDKIYLNKNIDMVITDTSISGMSAKELIVRIKANHNLSSFPVIVLTETSDEKEILEYLSLGVVDYVVKPFFPKELLLKIESVISMFRVKEDGIIREMTDNIKRFISKKNTSSAEYRLSQEINYRKLVEHRISKKEQRVIERVAEGLSYKDIAGLEDISENTVKAYIYRIYRKCCINNKTHLIKLFYS